MLLVAGALALYGLRRNPVAVLFSILGLDLCYALVGYPLGPMFISLAVAFFVTVLSGHRVEALISLAIGYPGFLVVSPLVNGQPLSPVGMVVVPAWLLLLFTVAERVRMTRQRAAEEARARRELTARRAGEERMRIARELHDVLAHNISLINVQAGVALHLMDDDPAQARNALSAIRQVSDELLREVRSVLDILRGDEETAPRTPAPGLRDLDELVERTSNAGFEVVKRVEGRERPVPRAVGLAAFRIVQEALTNSARHSGSSAAEVVVRFDDGWLEVRVEDRGRGGPVGEGGRGLVGMRERASALGGSIEAGPRPEGGFRVRAMLPLGEEESA